MTKDTEETVEDVTEEVEDFVVVIYILNIVVFLTTLTERVGIHWSVYVNLMF